LVISVIGACLLWVGWFGFNAGSAVAAGGLASSAFVATHFGAAAAVLGWLVFEWLKQGKPTVLGGISGAVAGLVGITPAAGFVTPMAALVIGFVAGAVCFFAVTEVKKRFGYDDSLDAFGVHGVGGFYGRYLNGRVCQQRDQCRLQRRRRESLAERLLEGNPKQVLNQLLASLTAIGLGVVGSFIILKIVDATVGVRVSSEDESLGLDLSQHGEEGYNLDTDLGLPVASSAAMSGSSLAAAAVVASE
jgi:Amt family ammonium transporter